MRRPTSSRRGRLQGGVGLQAGGRPWGGGCLQGKAIPQRGDCLGEGVCSSGVGRIQGEGLHVGEEDHLFPHKDRSMEGLR